MSYTAPPTFVASDVLTAAQLNVLSDDIAYLYSTLQGVTYSACSVRRAANQSLTTATETEISFDNEDLDIGGWYSSGTDIIVPAGAIPSGSTSVGVLLLGRHQVRGQHDGRAAGDLPEQRDRTDAHLITARRAAATPPWSRTSHRRRSRRRTC